MPFRGKGHSAYTLFLILILLILSEDVLFKILNFFKKQTKSKTSPIKDASTENLIMFKS